MAVTTSQRTTGNIAASQRVIDMASEINLLEPSAAPLTVVLNRIGKKKAAKDALFSWFNDQLATRFDAVNNGAGYTSGATSVVVDNGNLFAPEDLVKVPRTGEVMSVTSISTNTLTVERGIGTSTAAALVDNDPLMIIGQANEEGDTSPAPRSENPTKVDNYTQIFRKTVAMSGTLLSSSVITSPHDWAYQTKKMGIEHNIDKERAFLFNSPGTRTGADGGPRRTTGGVLNFATQNNQDAGGTLTEAEFETFARTVFRYGSDSRLLIASPLVLSVLNQYAVGKLQTIQSDNDKTYGLAITNYVSPHGTFQVVKHNLLEGATYGSYAIALDVKGDGMAYRFLNGDGPGGSRDTKLQTNIQENDRDGRKDEYLTECGLQFGNPQAHGVLYNVTG